MSMEDLIPDEDVVVSITRGGYAKRTLASTSTAPKSAAARVCVARAFAGGRCCRALHSRDQQPPLAAVLHQPGRVYRTKAYNLPEASRDAKGGHVAGLLSFQPDEQIAQVLAIRDYEQAPYLVLGHPQRFGEEDSPGGVQLPASGGRDRDQLPRPR
jgi:DNA gyrase subunit A